MLYGSRSIQDFGCDLFIRFNVCVYIKLLIAVGFCPHQKLLEAKLKRVYIEGEQARKAGRNPFETVNTDGRDEELAEEDLEERTERADANMAALLEEEAKAAMTGRKRKKKSRRWA